jgi:hypothetical protein
MTGQPVKTCPRKKKEERNKQYKKLKINNKGKLTYISNGKQR